MKLNTTTIRIYLNNVWSDPMTIGDFLRRHKDNSRIERVYITESLSRKEAIKLLDKFNQ